MQTDIFWARGDDGRMYLIYEVTEFRDVSDDGSMAPTWVAGGKAYHLSEGERIEQITQTDYRVAGSDLRLTRL